MAYKQGDIWPISRPNDYIKFFHTDPKSGHIYHGSQGKLSLKDYPLSKQVSDSIAPSDLCNVRQNRNKLHICIVILFTPLCIFLVLMLNNS